MAIGFVETLAAVQRGSVLQETELTVRGFHDLGHAEEAAHEHPTGRVDDDVVEEEDEANDRSERQ